MKNILFTLLISTVVVGCSTAHIAPKENTTSIIPVVYQYDLKADEGQEVNGLSNDLGDYINQNIESLIKLDIELVSSSETGEVLLKTAYELLLSLGADSGKIIVSKLEESNNIDFSLIAKKYEVQVPVCESKAIFAYGGDSYGCSVDSMRWSSIVNPERMLPKQSGDQLMYSQE
jgi:hypothetical protein